MIVWLHFVRADASCLSVCLFVQWKLVSLLPIAMHCVCAAWPSVPTQHANHDMFEATVRAILRGESQCKSDPC